MLSVAAETPSGKALRAFPFGPEVEEFLASHQQIFVVEQNRDAQLRSLLTLETAVEKAKLRSILYYSGLPMASSVIVEGVLAAGGSPTSMSEPRVARVAEGRFS